MGLTILVFNSTLVMYYLSQYLDEGLPPKSLVDKNLNTSGASIKNLVELINPESNFRVIEGIVFDDEVAGNLVPFFELDKKFDRDDLISLLFHMGFLTIKDVGFELDFTIPNYVMETIYSEYLISLLDQEEQSKIDTSKIKQALKAFANEGRLEPVSELVRDFLIYAANRDMQNFNEKNLKHTFSMFLSFSRQYILYAEYPAGQGFADILVQKSSGSYARYEGMIELKYIQKGKAKAMDITKLMGEGKAQLERYLRDRRLQDRKNLKKYVIIFVGFEEFYLDEIE